jgi:hypothetical protein
MNEVLGGLGGQIRHAGAAAVAILTMAFHAFLHVVPDAGERITTIGLRVFPGVRGYRGRRQAGVIGSYREQRILIEEPDRVGHGVVAAVTGLV